MFRKTKSQGFTLIELLVVIAIIGLLSSIALVSLNSARKKARNAKRVSDLRQIQSALELYYSDNNSYPNPGFAWRSECAGWGSYTPGGVIPGLVPTYLASFPSDPRMNKTTNDSCYIYLSNGTDFKLIDHNITENSAQDYKSQPSFLDPPRDGGSDSCLVDGSGTPWSWGVYSVAACTW